ncbi:MAG: hypothetical protein LBR40_03745 [Bacilli bacterium]|jgi:hypothetical protein|nr:hypothetical protein [Bacilli bacterium]
MAKVLIYLSDKNLELVQSIANDRFDGNRSRCVSELVDYIDSLEKDISVLKDDLMKIKELDELGSLRSRK